MLWSHLAVWRASRSLLLTIPRSTMGTKYTGQMVLRWGLTEFVVLKCVLISWRQKKVLFLVVWELISVCHAKGWSCNIVPSCLFYTTLPSASPTLPVWQEWDINAATSYFAALNISSDHLVHAVVNFPLSRSFLHTMSISRTTSMLISPPGPLPGTQPSWSSSHPRPWTPWQRLSRDTLMRFSSSVTGGRRMLHLDWSSPLLQCMVWVVMQWRGHSRLSTCPSLFLSLNRLATGGYVFTWGGMGTLLHSHAFTE